ncbi:hypothetical protein CPB85DRAFT_1455577 [Mucidula mucida]|nr:hypothetical protein CPB85DRAFT_1455577 [Mucidula mucida]
MTPLLKLQLAPVERGEPRADGNVPSKISTYAWLSNNYMIREEYQEIMLGILRWMEHRMTAGLEKTVEVMDVDLSWLEEPPTPGNLGLSKSLSWEKGVTTSGGIVLTGLPGIGKSFLVHFMRFALSASYFLWVLFNLRSAAGLPTLYLLDSPASTMFWKDGESYCIDMNHITCYELWNILPLDTWCLIDSHSVPEALIKSDCFILQAASPSRTETMGPQRAHCRTTQEELFRNFNCDETHLTEFHHLYGGSARDAYSFAHHRKDFEVSLELALCRLQPDSIWVAFCIEPSRSVPEPTSDLLSFFPVDDRKRTVWKVLGTTDADRDQDWHEESA